MARFGNISEEVTGDLNFKGRASFFQGLSGAGVQVYKDSQIWYVNKSKTNPAASGNGLNWTEAFMTITEALAAAGNYDTIFIGPGFYTEAAALTITQNGLKIIGCNTSGKMRGPCGWKTPTAAGTTVSIATGVTDVEIAGINFIAVGAYKSIVLGNADNALYVWRTHIHDCCFSGDTSGTYGITPYGFVTAPAGSINVTEMAETLIEDCWFYAWGTACIGCYGTRVSIRNNTFFIPTSGIGIDHGTGRTFCEITGNKFIGTGTTDTGIKLTGDNAASFLCAGNVFLNLNTKITQDVAVAGIASNNFIYHVSGTPTSIDPAAA